MRLEGGGDMDVRGNVILILCVELVFAIWETIMNLDP